MSEQLYRRVVEYMENGECAATFEPVDALAHTGQAAPAGEVASAPDKFWCETCEGGGMLHQEHQAGCWVGGDFPCPDCDGKGYWTRATPATEPAAPGYVSVPVEPTEAMLLAAAVATGSMLFNHGSIHPLPGDGPRITAAVRHIVASARTTYQAMLAAASTVQGKEKP